MKRHRPLIAALTLATTVSACATPWVAHTDGLPDAGSRVRVETTSGEKIVLDDAFLDGDLYVGRTGPADLRNWTRLPSSEIVAVETWAVTEKQNAQAAAFGTALLGGLFFGMVGIGLDAYDVGGGGWTEAFLDAWFDATFFGGGR